MSETTFVEAFQEVLFLQLAALVGLAALEFMVWAYAYQILQRLDEKNK